MYLGKVIVAKDTYLRIVWIAPKIETLQLVEIYKEDSHIGEAFRQHPARSHIFPCVEVRSGTHPDTPTSQSLEILVFQSSHLMIHCQKYLSDQHQSGTVSQPVLSYGPIG